MLLLAACTRGPQGGGQSGVGGMCIDPLACWCGYSAEFGPATEATVVDLVPDPKDRGSAVIQLDVAGEMTIGFANDCGGGRRDVAVGDRVLAFANAGSCSAAQTCIDSECGGNRAIGCVAECLFDTFLDCDRFLEITDNEPPNFRIGVMREGAWDFEGVEPLAPELVDVLETPSLCEETLVRLACNDTPPVL